MTVVWVVVGFSLAFDAVEWAASASWAASTYIFFDGVGMEPANPVYAAGVPFVLFATFQMMFAAITPALISGAFAERKRFGAFVALRHRLVTPRLLTDGPHDLGSRRPAQLAG